VKALLNGWRCITALFRIHVTLWPTWTEIDDDTGGDTRGLNTGGGETGGGGDFNTGGGNTGGGGDGAGDERTPRGAKDSRSSTHLLGQHRSGHEVVVGVGVGAATRQGRGWKCLEAMLSHQRRWGGWTQLVLV